MTSNTGSVVGCQRSRGGRVTALLLVLLLFYGAAVGAVHRHGNATLKSTADDAPMISDPGDANPSSKGLRQNGECLICQLHQNLYGGLFGIQLLTSPPLIPLELSAARAASYVSITGALWRGRAPPLISLP